MLNTFLIFLFPFVLPGLYAAELKMARSEPCKKGLSAFSQSVHSLVRKNCIPCHDEGLGQKAYPHSVEDLEKSYSRIQSYVDWSNIDKSFLVAKGGNGHCVTEGGNCTTTHEDLKIALRAWWQNGQKDCPPAGNIATKPQVVPQMNNGVFRKMSWVLDNFSPTLGDATIELEISRGEDQGFVFYILRKPRLNTPDKAVKIEGVHILINGRSAVFATAFRTVKAKILPHSGMGGILERYPVLSSSSAHILIERTGTDELALGLDVLEAIPSFKCRSIDRFREAVLPVVAARECVGCHSAGTAQKALPMDTDEESLCVNFLQRGGDQYRVNAPLIAFPLRRAFGHPGVIPFSEEIFPMWTEWLKIEGIGGEN